MKKIIIIIIVLAIVAAGILYFTKKKQPESESGMELAEVSRGDIENVVSSTGTLETTGTVEVGTQMSGTVSKVLVDYNDLVEVDQVLAIIDTTQLHLTMEASRAELQAAKARMLQAKLEYDSNQDLFEQELISSFDLESYRISYMSSEASYSSTKANYEKNRNNLELYSVIRSPISGIVIDRDIEEGQTVASSYSTPTLFTIAKNLSEMEIFAYVDESDIGQITKGMPVSFTVDAYPDNNYEGKVKQVRLMPETVSNVVNYIVVISARNTDMKLMPGMTATVDFIIEQKKDILRVSNTALKFRPSTDVMHAVMEKKRAQRQNDSTGTPSTASQRGTGSQPRENRSSLWYVDDSGEIDVMFVETGSTDGVYTEISGNKVKEGLRCITSMQSSGSSSTSNGLFQMPGPGGRPSGGSR